MTALQESWKITLINFLSKKRLEPSTLPTADSAPVCINIDISPEMAAQSAQQTKHFVSPHLSGPQLHQLDLASK